MDHEPVTARRDELLAAVRRAVGTRPAGSAAISEQLADTGHGDVHVVTVTPRAPGAAEVCLALLADEVTFTAGGTTMYLRVDDETPALLEAMVEAVLAGRIVERGPRRNAHAVLTLADGRQKAGGDALASLWPGRGRRWASCD